MKYLLDADTCLAFLAGHPNVVARTLPLKDAELATSFITIAELYFSVYSTNRTNENLKKVSDFANCLQILSGDRETAEIAGRIKADLRRNGHQIDEASLLVGCMALRYGLILVSNSMRRYEHIRGIQMENWII
ncbi:MAG TPA: PIN domain-containing protein [Blastocatellia bacterium]|nr:PIN domain-containing protein [Blastocatellia bacterium]